jgi:restriction system protein
MRIIDAIEKVLKDNGGALTHVQIYNLIKKENLFTFGAKDPCSVVRSKLRKHCYNLDFPSASPVKLFVISDNKSPNKKPVYSLYNSQSKPIRDNVSNVDSSKELLVEEVIHNGYKTHLDNLKLQLLTMIKSEDPAFFEKLVVDLLMKMGYGWNETTAGKAIGGAGDGGIDGVISEDKLGLENIYVQAKRYTNTKVPPKEVRDFAGAMVGEGARKGVFFTTSAFTAPAQTYARAVQGMSITLVDGDMLVDLLIQHEMAIAPIKKYTVYEVDKNFFSND